MSDLGFDPLEEGGDGVADLGHGVRIKFTGLRDHPGHHGLIESHPDGRGGRCSGSIAFDTPARRELDEQRPLWTVEQWEPLTLSPSLLCRACGHHGFIREGRWVPA